MKANEAEEGIAASSDTATRSGVREATAIRLEEAHRELAATDALRAALWIVGELARGPVAPRAREALPWGWRYAHLVAADETRRCRALVDQLEPIAEG